MTEDEDFKLLKIQTFVLGVNIHCDGCKQKVKKILQRIEGHFFNVHEIPCLLSSCCSWFILFSPSYSRSVSPFSRTPSPQRSAITIPTTSVLSFSKCIGDGLKKTNELLNKEVLKLRAQVESLRQRCELQEVGLLKSTKKHKKLWQSMPLVTEESAKSKAAKEVIKSLTAQDRLDKTEIRHAKSAVPSNVDLIKQLDSKASKQRK